MSEPTEESGPSEMAMEPAYIPPKVLTRPASVTILVVLLWIWIALTLLAGVVLLVAGIGIAATSVASVEKALIDGGMSVANATQLAPVLGGLTVGGGIALLLVSVLVMLLALFVSKGSNVARILLTIIVVVRILSALATLTRGFAGGVVLAVVLEVALDAILLWLMYNASARRFFNDQVAVG